MITATRIAALYDIHGNLPALEAVLETISQRRACFRHNRRSSGADL